MSLLGPNPFNRVSPRSVSSENEEKRNDSAARSCIWFGTRVQETMWRTQIGEWHPCGPLLYSFQLEEKNVCRIKNLQCTGNSGYVPGQVLCSSSGQGEDLVGPGQLGLAGWMQPSRPRPGLPGGASQRQRRGACPSRCANSAIKEK